MSISYQAHAKLLFQHKVQSENLELQRRQKLLRMPMNGVPFHKVVEEFCVKQIDLKCDFDSEVISRLLQLQQKSRKEIQALQKAFGNLKFFIEAYEYLAKKEFQGLLQEIQYEKFDQYQKVFDFDELGYKYYIILKGSVFVQIPNKNYKKYEEKGRLALDLRLATRNSQNNLQNSKTSSRRNSSNSSSSSNSSLDSLPLASPTKLSLLQPNIKITKPTKPSGKNELKNYFQFQEQGIQNKNIEEIQKQHNPNARKSVILAINTIKQVNKFDSKLQFHLKNNANFKYNNKASKLKNESGKEKSAFSQLKLSSRSYKPNMGSNQNLDEDESAGMQTQKEIDPKDKINAIYPQFDIVRELGAGEAFGEIALINNARRTASIICKEETTFAVLSKQSYDKILSQYHQAEQEKNISFLKEFTIFNQLGKSKLDALFRIMEKQEFKKNQVIYSEGDQAKYVYFIRDGEIEMSQQCLKGNQNLSNNQQQGDPEYLKMMENYNLKWRGQQQKESIKRIKIAILGQNNYFGQEEIISNIPRLYRAQVFSTQAVMYTLPKQKFLSTVKLFSYSMDTMQKELSKRATWRISQLEKNLTTCNNIESEIQKVQNEFAKVEFAEQTLKKKPEVVTEFIGSELDAMQKEYLAQDEMKNGIIRSDKDVNKLNEDIINSLKGKKKIKQFIKSGEKKPKLFKLSLKNNLFQEETDKINQRMKKKIMSPREFKQFLFTSSQRFINSNTQGKERDEMVKELLNIFDQKSQQQLQSKQTINLNIQNQDIHSFQYLPIDPKFNQSAIDTPISYSQNTPQQTSSNYLPNTKKFKSMMVIHTTIQNDNIQSSSNIQSMYDILNQQKNNSSSKYIQYDSYTPSSRQAINQEQLPTHNNQNLQDLQDDSTKNMTKSYSNNNPNIQPKRVQSAHPKIGSNNNNNNNNNNSHHQKYIIFPSNSPSKKLSDKEKKYFKEHQSDSHHFHPHNIYDSHHITKDETKSINLIQAIQEEGESPKMNYKFDDNHTQLQKVIQNSNQLFKSQSYLSKKSTSIHENYQSNNVSPQRKSVVPQKINVESDSTLKKQVEVGEVQQSQQEQIQPQQQQQQDQSSAKVIQNNNNIIPIFQQITPRNINLSHKDCTISFNTKSSNKIHSGMKSKSICTFEIPKQTIQTPHNSKNHYHHQCHTKQIIQKKNNKGDEQSQNFNTNKIQQTQSLTTKQILEHLQKKQQNEQQQLIQHQPNHFDQSINFRENELAQFQSTNQINSNHNIQNNPIDQNNQQGQEQRISSISSTVKSKTRLNQIELSQDLNYPLKSIKSSEYQLFDIPKQRPQSSLIGSYEKQYNMTAINSPQQYNISGINSPQREYMFQSGGHKSFSNLCSPVSQKDSAQNLHNLFPISSNQSLFRTSLLYSPKQEQQPSEFKVDHYFPQPNATTFISSQTQTNLSNNQVLNSLNNTNFKESQTYRNQVISPKNLFSNKIKLPRSYQKESKDKQELKSINIHMDKLRFTKNTMEIKDPFKNTNKLYKKHLSHSISQLQSPKMTSASKAQNHSKIE